MLYYCDVKTIHHHLHQFIGKGYPQIPQQFAQRLVNQTSPRLGSQSVRLDADPNPNGSVSRDPPQLEKAARLCRCGGGSTTSRGTPVVPMWRMDSPKPRQECCCHALFSAGGVLLYFLYVRRPWFLFGSVRTCRLPTVGTAR